MPSTTANGISSLIWRALRSSSSRCRLSNSRSRVSKAERLTLDLRQRESLRILRETLHNAHRDVTLCWILLQFCRYFLYGVQDFRIFGRRRAKLHCAFQLNLHTLQAQGRQWHPVLPRVRHPFHRNLLLSGLQGDVGSTLRHGDGLSDRDGVLRARAAADRRRVERVVDAALPAAAHTQGCCWDSDRHTKKAPHAALSDPRGRDRREEGQRLRCPLPRSIQPLTSGFKMRS